MTVQRGLTLVEVLAALLLLSLIAGTCLPLLRSIRIHLEEAEPAIELYELAQLADRTLTRAGTDLAEGGPVRFELPWERVQERPLLVHVRVVKASESDEIESLPHAWVIFESDGLVVSRWIPKPSDEDQQ